MRSIHTSVFSMMPERPAKKRMRKALLVKILRRAAFRGATEFGLSLLMLYTFLLRGPSEWWGQADPKKLDFKQGHLRYGQIVRKHRKEMVTLYRECVCKRSPLLCVHKWWMAYSEQRETTGLLNERYLTMTPTQWTLQLREYIAEIHPHLTTEDLATWTSHCCRRGAAADILHRQGLTGKGGLDDMLREADWASAKGSHPYTPADEIEAVTMGELMIEELD
jgi:hypothetical protein